MRSGIVLAAAVAFLAAACGGDSNESAALTTDVTTAATTRSAASIVGEWRRETTCDELAQALRNAGMEEQVDEFVAGNGFIPGIGVDDPERIDPRQPCIGAVPRVHSHFFTADGGFGSRDWTGQDVDDGRWRVDGDKLVISKEFPEVTFRYRIQGDTITFEPLDIPHGCTSFRCGWSIAVAYPGKTWTRVSTKSEAQAPPGATLPAKLSPELVQALRRDASMWAALFADTGCNENKYMAEPMCERMGSVPPAFQKSFANATVQDIEHDGTAEVGPPAGSIYVAAVTFSNGVVVVFGGGRPEAVPSDESCPGAGSGCVWKVEGPDQNRRFMEAATG